MTLIIGIDPGSRRTGYGLIRLEGNRHIHIASGCLSVESFPTCERLRQVYEGLKEIIQTYSPQEAAIEQIFLHQNPNTALKLGQARGAAIVALNMPVIEYSARQVKKSVVGHGGANKEQVQFMVRKLLNLSGKLVSDAADALAIALCHAQIRNWQHLGIDLTKAKKMRSRRLTFAEANAIIKGSANSGPLL